MKTGEAHALALPGVLEDTEQVCHPPPTPKTEQGLAVNS